MEPEKSENGNLGPSQSAVAVEPREPWEKLPRESQKAFQAFTLYRDAEKRSFKSVAEKLNCSPQNIFQWSSKYKWKLRADAYDLEQDRLQRIECAHGLVRRRERHMAVAGAMLNVAGHALREWVDRIEQRLPLHLAPEQIALLTKCAIEIERSTTGEGGDRRPPTINILLGVHQYDDEKAGDSRQVEGESEWIPQPDFEREQYERLSDEERRSLDVWKDPPKPKQFN
jgi:hypothetical protein